MTNQHPYEVGHYVLVTHPDSLMTPNQPCEVVKIFKGEYVVTQNGYAETWSGEWLALYRFNIKLLYSWRRKIEGEWVMSKKDDICPDSPPQPPNLYADLYRDVARYINMGYEVPLPFDDSEGDTDDE